MKIYKILCAFLFVTSALHSQFETIDKDHNIPHQILATSKQFVYVKSKEFYWWGENTQRWTKISALPDDDINRFRITSNICAADDRGYLWILLPGQVLQYQQQTDRWSYISLPNEIKNISNSLFAFSTIEEWNGSLWIATPQNISQYDFTTGSWSFYDYPEHSRGGLLKKGPNNALWLNGNSYFNGKTWANLPEFAPINWIQSRQQISWDSQKRPWVATVQGVFYYDYVQKQWISTPSETAFNKIVAITFFKNTVWVADYGEGIFQRSDNQWHQVQINTPRPALAYCQEFFQTESRFWLNTYFGVASFDGTEWKSHYDFTQYYPLRKLFLLTTGSIIGLMLIATMIFLRRRSKDIEKI